MGEITERLERQRERLLDELDVELGMELPNQIRYSPIAERARQLAAALLDVDRVLAANRQPPAPVPPFDVQDLGQALWAAVEDAGGSTAVGDAVLEALKVRLP